jgi:hypothetical protein
MLEAGVVTFAVLCLVIKSLRLYAVAAIALLAAIHPLAALTLAVVSSARFLIYRSKT